MKGVFIFLAGAGVGAGATWYFVKKHYEKIADEEIADVVNRFKVYKETLDEEYAGVQDENPNPNYEGKSGRSNVVPMERPVQSDSDEELSNGVIDNPRGESNVVKPKEETFPYVISEEEFGENEDYEQKTLFWYYRDNILATDEDLEVEDVRSTVGDALEEFKKDRYTERVLVADDTDEIYYEILISEKHFYEVTGGDTE